MTTNTKLRAALQLIADGLSEKGPRVIAAESLALTQHDEDAQAIMQHALTVMLRAQQGCQDMDGAIAELRQAIGGAAIAREFYTYMGESGLYEHLSVAKGAGVLHGALYHVYKDMVTGQSYVRTPADFDARMQPLAPPAEKASAESAPADHAKRAGSFELRPLFEEWASDPIRSEKLPLDKWPDNDGYKDTRTYTAFYGWKAGYQRGQQAGDALTDEMRDAGGEALYGHPRSSAIEWAKEDKFDSCVYRAEQVWGAMCAARASAAKEDE